MQKPVIAINCDIKRNEEVCADYLSTYTDYPDSVERAGGVPLLIPPLADEADLREVLKGVHGIVLTGGDDIDPAAYGQEWHEKSTPIFPRRQNFDLRLVPIVLEMGLPTLGVCDGHEEINIALGGTLHQHVPDVYGMQIIHARGKELARRGEERYHNVSIEPDSMVAEITGKTRLEVNSIHQQAIDRLGEGLRVTARSIDGVIEAIEYADRREKPFILGLQWHPERLSANRPDQLALFEALVRAAIEYRAGERV